jgi:hypothetical protein
MGTSFRTPTVPPSPEIQTRYRAACVVMNEGDTVEAERLFLELLADMRGRDELGERYALAGLSTIYARNGRDFEALVLLRLITDCAVAAKDWERAANTLTNYCILRCQLEPTADLRVQVAVIADLLAKLPEDRAIVAREDIHLIRASQALERGDLLSAATHTRSFEQAPTRDTREWRKQMTALGLRASVAMREGDGYRAMAYLDKAAAYTPTDSAFPMVFTRHRLEAALVLGSLDRLAAWVREALAQLEAAADQPEMASTRIRLGTCLADACERLPGNEALLHRIYDLTAAAIMTRIAQLDEAVRKLPELGLGRATFDEELVALRKQFVRERREILDRVASFLEAAGANDEGGPFLHDDGFVRVCAWCESVRPQSGAWLSIGHFVPRSPQIKITHTMCPSCAERQKLRA